MDVDVRMREEQLKTFDAFIQASYAQIDRILKPVGWTKEYLVKENTKMVCCPLNSEHRVPEQSLEKHLESCAWYREGYRDFDVPLPENSVQNPSCVKTSITIDASLQAAILKEAKQLNPSLITGDLESDERPLPQTSDRFIADFTSDERLALYDYVVSKTTPAEDIKVEELHMFDDRKNETPRPKSKLELLIEERNAKRRRISYRKKVHTNRKTQTEILREVIQNQMELLEQIIKEEENNDKDYENTSDSVEVSKNGEKICDESFASSHPNYEKREECDGVEERYERQYSRPYSKKRLEDYNKSDEHDSKRRRMEHSRSRNESNETTDRYPKGSNKHFRESGSSYENKCLEERFPDRHRNWERGNEMYYKGKSRHDYGGEESKRKHKNSTSFRNSDYDYDAGSYSDYRKETHVTESYQKDRHYSSGPSSTSTSKDYLYSVPQQSPKQMEHSNHCKESGGDEIFKPPKTYEEHDDSLKKHKKKKKKKKKKHHKHKSKKKHKKRKSSSSSSENSSECS